MAAVRVRCWSGRDGRPTSDAGQVVVPPAGRGHSESVTEPGRPGSNGKSRADHDPPKPGHMNHDHDSDATAATGAHDMRPPRGPAGPGKLGLKNAMMLP